MSGEQIRVNVKSDMKWIIVGMAFLGIVIFIVMTSGANVASAQIEKSFGTPEDLGPLVESVATLDTAYGIEDGTPMMYTTTNGNPAVFQVIDLEAHEVVERFPLNGSTSVWTHVTDHDGNVYIGGTGRLYKYDPVQRDVSSLGIVESGARAVYGLSVDEKNNVYGGTYPHASVFKYDPHEDQFSNYGSMSTEQEYVRSGAYANGYYYAGIGTTGSIVKLDVASGQTEAIPIPERPDYYNLDNLGSIYGMNVVGDYLFAMISGSNTLIVYDLVNENWIDTTIDGYRGLYTSPEKDGKTYFVANNELMSFDLDTHEVSSTGIPFGTYLRNSTWMEWADDPELPGESLVTIQYGGSVTLLNLETKTVTSMLPVVAGEPTSIHSLSFGPDNKLYSSGYMGTYGSQFDVQTGENAIFNLGQAEGITSLGDTVYFGVYPGAHIDAFDTTAPPESDENPKRLFTIGDGQDRPFAMHASEETNQLFIGTISTYGELGGALTIYDVESGEVETHRNIVENQSIIGLAYRDGKVYGSTTVWGGLGIEPTEEAAKMFVWDVEAGEKVAEFIPDLPSGSGVPAKAIGGLRFGPDGLLWGASRGVIFAMDPETFEIVKSEDLYPTDWNFNHYWRPVNLEWGDDGYLYTTLASRIVVIDPETLDHVELQNASLMSLGADGHIYYADSAHLKKIEVSDGAPDETVTVSLPMTNPSFDEPLENGDIPGWEPTATPTEAAYHKVSDERAYTGESSLKIVDTSTSATAGVISDPIEVEAGVEYTLRSNVFLDDGRTILALRFYDEAGNELSSEAAYIESGHGSWQEVNVRAVAPDDAVHARIVAFCSLFWMTTAYYDNFALTYEQEIPDELAEPLVIDPVRPVATSDEEVDIVVQAAAGTEIQIMRNDEVIATGQGEGIGSDVSVTVGSLPHGINKLTVRVVDPFGNESESVAIPHIIIHRGAPSQH